MQRKLLQSPFFRILLGAWAWRLPSYPGSAGYRIPTSALRDAGYIYMVAVPVFLIGSLWEFLA